MKKKVAAMLGGAILAVVGFGFTASPASADEEVCAPEVNVPPVVARVCVRVTP